MKLTLFPPVHHSIHLPNNPLPTPPFHPPRTLRLPNLLIPSDPALRATDAVRIPTPSVAELTRAIRRHHLPPQHLKRDPRAAAAGLQLHAGGRAA